MRSGDGAQAYSPCTLWLLHLSYYLFFFTTHQATRFSRARKCVGTHSCLALRNPMDFCPPVSSVHWIFQARILEEVAISFTRRSSLLRDRICISWVFCIGRWILYQVAQLVKNLQRGRPGFDPWVEKIPWWRKWLPIPVFLLGESPWTEEPGRLQSMGLQRVGHNWATKHSTVHSATWEAGARLMSF